MEITFTDEGPGVPPEIRRRLFDPYFSTKATGTACVDAIVRQHGGTIHVDEGHTGGAQFHLVLPTGTRRYLPRRWWVMSWWWTRTRAHLASARARMEDTGLQVQCPPSVPNHLAALAWLDAHTCDVAVVGLPLEDDGFFEQVHSYHPHVPLVIASTHASPGLRTAADVLPHPYTRQDLIAVLTRVLGSPVKDDTVTA